MRADAGRPPCDQLGVVVPVETTLATSPRAMIDLVLIRVYSSCCVLEISWMLRRTTETVSDWLDRLLTRPRFSVALGERAGVAALPDLLAPGRGPVRAARPGNGGDARYGKAELLWSPLPPAGELRLTVDWPEFGVHAATTVLDGAAVVRAVEYRLDWGTP